MTQFLYTGGDYDFGEPVASKKPGKKVIREVVPLCKRHPEWRTFKSLTVCNLCGTEDDHYLFRECDENDEPLPGIEHVLLICEACEIAHLKPHPRLYVDDAGGPGYWPRLCGYCAWRDGPRCAHPKLKANGGTGLRISMAGGGTFMCDSGGLTISAPQPVECAGRGAQRIIVPDALSSDWKHGDDRFRLDLAWASFIVEIVEEGGWRVLLLRGEAPPTPVAPVPANEVARHVFPSAHLAMAWVEKYAADVLAAMRKTLTGEA